MPYVQELTLGSHMSKVFMSYAREDLELVKKLEHYLINQKCQVWPDQESIYAGQNWPKVIGEALADNDFLLLVWSKQAQKSHFVEFEWTTAVALKKQILPVFLDEIPLPPALSAVKGIALKNPEADFPKILKALQISISQTEPEHTSEIIKKLDEITTVEPEEAIKAVKNISNQQVSNVKGNVYLAARDVIVTQPQTAEKSWLQRWQVWAAVVTAAVGLIAGIPKIVDGYRQLFPPKTAVFTGSVRDTDGHPIAGAVLQIQGKRGVDTTDSSGNFNFEVEASPGTQIWVTVSKDGRVGFDDYAWLTGSTPIPFDTSSTRRLK